MFLIWALNSSWISLKPTGIQFKTCPIPSFHHKPLTPHFATDQCLFRPTQKLPTFKRKKLISIKRKTVLDPTHKSGSELQNNRCVEAAQNRLIIGSHKNFSPANAIVMSVPVKLALRILIEKKSFQRDYFCFCFCVELICKMAQFSLE